MLILFGLLWGLKEQHLSKHPLLGTSFEGDLFPEMLLARWTAGAKSKPSTNPSTFRTETTWTIEPCYPTKPKTLLLVFPSSTQSFSFALGWSLSRTLAAACAFALRRAGGGGAGGALRCAFAALLGSRCFWRRRLAGAPVGLECFGIVFCILPRWFANIFQKRQAQKGSFIDEATSQKKAKYPVATHTPTNSHSVFSCLGLSLNPLLRRAMKERLKTFGVDKTFSELVSELNIARNLVSMPTVCSL